MNGAVDLVDEKMKTLGSAGDLLRGKFAPSGVGIRLGGCYTAKGGENIAKALSKVVPDVYVRGYPVPTTTMWPQYGVPPLLFGGRITGKNYINGQEILFKW